MSDYEHINVDVEAVLDDWRGSLLAHTWLDREGRLRAFDDLSEKAQADLKSARDEDKSNAAQPPILGIGITDCVEICTGTARFMMLAARGEKTITVRIRPNQKSELQKVIK